MRAHTQSGEVWKKVEPRGGARGSVPEWGGTQDLRIVPVLSGYANVRSLEESESPFPQRPIQPPYDCIIGTSVGECKYMQQGIIRARRRGGDHYAHAGLGCGCELDDREHRYSRAAGGFGGAA